MLYLGEYIQMTMALDKSYIDRSDDSLVNIAVNYYRHRHNSAYKFKSYYYQARIYQNAGEMDKAMESLVRSESIQAAAGITGCSRVRLSQRKLRKDGRPYIRS